MESPLPLPSRSTVLDRLNDLLEGRITREEAATWADQWLLADQTKGMELEVSDFAVWEALNDMSAADLPTTDRPYLYGESDFAAWVDELRNAPK